MTKTVPANKEAQNRRNKGLEIGQKETFGGSVRDMELPVSLGGSGAPPGAGMVAGAQRRFLEEKAMMPSPGWGRSSDTEPTEQLWPVMYQCIRCCPRYRQVWEQIPQETIH